MADIDETHCCGVQYISWITGSDAVAALLAPARRAVHACRYDPHTNPETMPGIVSTYLYTDVRLNNERLHEHSDYDGESGAALSMLILENGLGKVTSGEWVTNTYHTDRKLKTHVWTVDIPAYKKWALKQQSLKTHITDTERAQKANANRWR